MIFPTFALQACFASDDAEFQRQLCRAYNSWAIDVFDDHRLLAGRHGVDARHRRRHRRGQGAWRSRGSGRCSSPRRCRRASYNDGAYDPFWAVAQELGLPLTFHSGTGHEPRVVRGPGGAVDQLPHGRAARRPDGDPHPGRRWRARPLPRAARRHRRDRRVVAGVDHDPGRRDLRRPQHVREAEAVAEAERADPPPVRGDVHVRPGRDQQPRTPPASRRSCGATTTRTPKARGPSRRRVNADQFDGVADDDLDAIVSGNAARVFGFDLDELAKLQPVPA